MISVSYNEFLAYTAGVIDGEGCLRINRYNSHAPMITIVNTNCDMLNEIALFLHTCLDVKCCGSYHDSGKPSEKVGYTLQINKWRDIACVCLAIKPYVINKLPHVELMLEYISECRFEQRGNVPLPEALKVKRITYWQKFSKLNARGKP